MSFTFGIHTFSMNCRLWTFNIWEIWHFVSGSYCKTKLLSTVTINSWFLVCHKNYLNLVKVFFTSKTLLTSLPLSIFTSAIFQAFIVTTITCPTHSESFLSWHVAVSCIAKSVFMPIFMSLNSHRNLWPNSLLPLHKHCVNVSVTFPFSLKIQGLISILTFFQFFHILKHSTNKTLTANTKRSEMRWLCDIKLLGLYVCTHLFCQLLQRNISPVIQPADLVVYQ